MLEMLLVLLEQEEAGSVFPQGGAAGGGSIAASLSSSKSQRCAGKPRAGRSGILWEYVNPIMTRRGGGEVSAFSVRREYGRESEGRGRVKDGGGSRKKGEEEGEPDQSRAPRGGVIISEEKINVLLNTHTHTHVHPRR